MPWPSTSACSSRDPGWVRWAARSGAKPRPRPKGGSLDTARSGAKPRYAIIESLPFAGSSRRGRAVMTSVQLDLTQYRQPLTHVVKTFQPADVAAEGEAYRVVEP